MRLLADENLKRAYVEALRARGHDVAWVREGARGAADEAVLARASAEGRTLVTFDRDFGALAFQAGQAAHAGVVLFRLDPLLDLTGYVVAVVESRPGPDGWAGLFASVSERGIRVRPLRPPP